MPAARFERLRRGAGAPVFLSKRTANNRRLRLLATIFPNARYVHLVRDGREVAQSLSTVEWWNGHTVWWDGRTALEMERAGEPRLAICARNWVRELEAVRAQLAQISPDRVLELDSSPCCEIRCASWSASCASSASTSRTSYRDAIESLQLRPAPGKWQSDWGNEQLACVLDEVQPMLHELGYTP